MDAKEGRFLYPSEQLGSAETVSDDVVQRYRRDGFVHIPQLLTPEEVRYYLADTREVLEREEKVDRGGDGQTVLELVPEVQLKSTSMRDLALHPRITEIAERLAGQPLRLFRQELLVKTRERSLPTGAHTDDTAFPISGAPVTLSAWVALVDVPIERGCLSFVAGSHLLRPAVDHEYPMGEDPAVRWPGSQWLPIVTVPLRAGDCTFHDARTIHMAEANETTTPRISTISVYMDADAVYRPTGVELLDRLPGTRKLTPGTRLVGDRFPLVRRAPQNSEQSEVRV